MRNAFRNFMTFCGFFGGNGGSFLVAAALLCIPGTANANDQSDALHKEIEIKAGAVLAIPTGDAADFSGFGLGADVYYMFGKEDAWLNFGPTVGFRNYFGKEIEADLFGETFSIDVGDVQFLPLAGAFRAKAFGLLNWGTDIGYAVGISDGNDGGFYFRPIVGVENRALTMFGMPATNASTMPPTPTTRVIQESDNPS